MPTTVNVGSGGTATHRAVVKISADYTSATYGESHMVAPIMANTTSPWDITTFALANGDNLLPLNTACAGVIFIPPTTNTKTIVIKGSLTDTGIQVCKIAPTLLSFDYPPPAGIYITTSGIISNCMAIMY